MQRASTDSNPPHSAAAAVKNVSSNAGHSDPSCSASAHQSFRPVTRSMTRPITPIMASSDLKEGGSGSTSTRRSISDASFSIQSAAFRPTVTRHRTPHKVTTCTWKPLTQPVALSEEQKCSTLTAINPTAKRSRVVSSRVANDPTNHSASKANSNVLTGKKSRDEESTSQGDQLDGAVIQSPTKKLQTCKAPSDVLPKRISSIRILGAKEPAPLPTGRSHTQFGNSSASVPPKVVSAGTNSISKSADVAVPFFARQPQPDTGKNSIFITESFNEARQGNQLAANVVRLPRQNLKTDYQKMPSVLPVVTNQASGSTGATYQKMSSVVPVMTNQASRFTGATYQKMPSVAPVMTNQASGLTGATYQKMPSVVPVMTNQASRLTGATYQRMRSVVPVMTNQASGLTGAPVPMVLPKLEIGKANDTSSVHKTPSVAPVMVNQVSGMRGATYQKMRSVVPVMTNQASGLSGASAPMVLPKLEIGRANDTSSVHKMPSVVPVMANQVSGLPGATAPMVLPKLEIGNAKDASNIRSNPAYARALLVKQQEQLLKQYNFGSSQQQQQGQQQQQQVHIKGPALPWNDDVPPVEPLGTRCQLCKLDVAFRPQGDAGRDASAPPVVAVLACHHAFHSSCIESVYGLAEPSQCIACVELGIAH